MTGSVLLYVQHLLGIGHLRRSLIIAEALVREGIRVTLISGGEPLSSPECTSAERVIQLPPIRACDAGFKVLVDEMGRADFTHPKYGVPPSRVGSVRERPLFANVLICPAVVLVTKAERPRQPG